MKKHINGYYRWTSSHVNVDYNSLSSKPSINNVTIEGAKSDTDYLLQRMLTAGENITITDNPDGTQTISTSGIDLFIVLSELPAEGEENRIYLIPKTESETGNEYNEYIWIEGAFENIGHLSLDLSNYTTTSELQANYKRKPDFKSYEETDEPLNLIPQTDTDMVMFCHLNILEEVRVITLAKNSNLVLSTFLLHNNTDKDIDVFFKVESGLALLTPSQSFTIPAGKNMEFSYYVGLGYTFVLLASEVIDEIYSA